MKRHWAVLAGTVAITLAVGGGARAECSYRNMTPLKSLSAGFEAWKTITGALAQCGNINSELDQEFQTKLAAALAAKPALYQIVGLANDSVVGPLNAGTIRPLDDLVAKYGKSLSPIRSSSSTTTSLVSASM